MRSATAVLARTLVLCALVGGPALAQDPALTRRIETLQDQGFAAYSTGQLDKAAKLYFEAFRAATDNGRVINAQFYETVKNLANIVAELGRLNDAAMTYDRVIPEFEKSVGADHPWSLDLKTDFAQLLSGHGRPDVAVTILEPVLAAYRAATPPTDPLTLARVGNELGVAYTRAGMPDKAVPVLEVAAREREGQLGLASERTLNTYVNLARVLEQTGRVEESDRIYDRILPVIDSTLGLNHPLSQTARVNLAGRLGEEGRPREAIPLLRQGLKEREARLPPGDVGVLTARKLLANGLLATGEIEESLALHAANVQAVRAAFGTEGSAMITVLSDYSAALKATGRTERAAELDLERLELARRTMGPTSEEAAIAMSDVAIGLRDQGQTEAAVRMLTEAHEALVSTAGAEDPVAINLEINLAVLAAETARPERALAAYDAAAARAKRVFGPEHPITIRAEVNGFNYRFERGLATLDDADRVAVLAETARATHGPDSDVTRKVEQAVVLALSSSKRPADQDRALETARRALGEAATRISRPRDGRDPALTVATAQFRQSAFVFANLTTQVVERAGSAEQLDALRDEAFRATQMMGFGAVGNAMRTAAMRSAARRAGLSAELSAWERTLAGVAQLSDAHAKAALASPDGELARIEAESASLVAEQARLEALISAKAPGLFDLLTPRAIGFEDLARGPYRLGPDEALVLIAPAPGESMEPPLVWVISGEGVAIARAGMSTPDLDRAVAAFRASLAAPAAVVAELARAPVSPGSKRASGARPRPVDLTLGHDIYAALFGAPPVQKALAGKTHVILAPQGSLLSLPFSALPTTTPEPGAEASADGLRGVQWLGLARALSVVPSVASLTETRRGAEDPAPAARTAYVGFGDPAFQGAARPLRGADIEAVAGARDRMAALSGLPALPATAWEVATVAEAFPSPETRVFLGAEASEARFGALADAGGLDGVGVLHFATHGLLANSLAGLNEPALALSPPDAPRVLGAGEVDDGLLTASEIAVRDFDADWVVLSACDTGAGESAGAEGLSGLAKAFFFAGAGSLLVTHWAVDDVAAARIIVATVQGTRTGMAASEARRRAIATLVADRSRDGTNLPFAHPAVWAPFELIGEPAER